MTTLAFLLHPAYEPGDGSADGAQLVDGQWWHPQFGCDSLQYAVNNARQALAPAITPRQEAAAHAIGRELRGPDA